MSPQRSLITINNKKQHISFLFVIFCITLLSTTYYNVSPADDNLTNSQTTSQEIIFSKPSLYQTAFPYITYFKEKALKEDSGFTGLTKSFQLCLDDNASSIIRCGAFSYDQIILGRICLYNSPPDTTILDTYISYFKKLDDPNNPLFNTNGNYYDGNNQPLRFGPYAIIRLTERAAEKWVEKWDWRIDIGAASTLILYALDAHQQIPNNTKGYKELAISLAEYMLKLQDADGGIRYGPRGMWHSSDPVDFFWHLKSTEQNERALYALEALYETTNNTQYQQAAVRIKDWLKEMYDFSAHLYESAAIFNKNTLKWEKAGFTYIATDVMALAPLIMMFSDPYFGATQDQRDKEVEDMFAAIEKTTAFLDQENNPILFRFSNGQEGDYGSVEWSAQMALAYLQAAQSYAQRNEAGKIQQYLNKYNTLVISLDKYFTAPADAPQAKIAPYTSYLDRTVAGNVPTGTGFETPNCQAALASIYFSFTKAGFDPVKINGGLGIPQLSDEEHPNPTTDTTPPTIPIVVDEGKVTINQKQLSALWASEDLESGIIEFKYSIIKNSPQGEVIKEWTSTEVNNVTVTELNLQTGKTYYFAVQAKNGANVWSKTGFSNGITVVSNIQNNPPELSLIGNKEVYSSQLLEFTVTANDPDNDPLTYSAGILPQGATFNTQTATFSWTPSVQQVGMHNVHFEVKDTELQDEEDITITVKKSSTPTENNVPVANSQVVSTEYNTPLAITLIATDKDNDNLVYSIVTLPAYGTLTKTLPKVTYTPKNNYHGQDSFTFKVNDGKADSNIATVKITINDAPVIKNSPPKLNEINNCKAKVGQWIVIPITGSDSDGNKLSLTLEGTPQNAYFYISNTEYKKDNSSYIKASFCWKPQTDQIGTHKIILTLSDAEASDTNIVEIEVERSYCPKCLQLWHNLCALFRMRYFLLRSDSGLL